MLLTAVRLSLAVLFLSSTLSFGQNCNLGAPSTTPPAGVSVFIGNDIEFSALPNRGNATPASRQALDLQDDPWRTASQAATFSSFSAAWSGGPGATTPNPTGVPLVLFSFQGVTVTAALHNVAIGDADCDGAMNGNQGELAATDNMQDAAPRPNQFFIAGAQPRFWNENAGSPATRNAVVFSFTRDVNSFGAWFGDVETRADGPGQPALLRLVDVAGNRIGNDIIIPPNGTPDQSICGGVSDSTSPSACGNETSRWIGFVDTNSPARIRSAILIVGDDDDPGEGNSDGGEEHLSFIGATLAQIAPSSAQVSISGRIETPEGQGIGRVSVTVVNPLDPSETFSAISNPFGNFTVVGLTAGNTYVVSVGHKSYVFPEPTQTIQVNEDLTGIIFIANGP